jgi:hypothetical protein
VSVHCHIKVFGVGWHNICACTSPPPPPAHTHSPLGGVGYGWAQGAGARLGKGTKENEIDRVAGFTYLLTYLHGVTYIVHTECHTPYLEQPTWSPLQGAVRDPGQQQQQGRASTWWGSRLGPCNHLNHQPAQPAMSALKRLAWYRFHCHCAQQPTACVQRSSQDGGILRLPQVTCGMTLTRHWRLTFSELRLQSTIYHSTNIQY